MNERHTKNRADEVTLGDRDRDAQADRDALAELVKAGGRRPVPAGDDYRRVLAASREVWRQAVESRRRRRRYFALAASVAVLAVGASVVTQLAPPPPPPPVASTAVLDGQVMALAPDAAQWRTVDGVGVEWLAGTRLRTPAGNRISLDLSWGGSLRVDETTELTLTSAERLELIAGTIYFDSGAEAGPGALEVATAHGLVREIGTQFEVMSTDAALRVRVREGGVEIERGQQLPRLTGAAGEQVRLDSAGAAEIGPFLAHDPAWSWAVALADVPSIDGRPLMELLDWVARETGHELQFADAVTENQARGVTMHGSLENATPRQALEAALATTDLEHVFREDGVLLIRTP